MLRGGVVVVTAIFSVVFLKKKLTLTQILGCTLTIIGIGIVGLSNLIFPMKSSSSTSSVITDKDLNIFVDNRIGGGDAFDFIVIIHEWYTVCVRGKAVFGILPAPISSGWS
jgi:hypothetical protein